MSLLLNGSKTMTIAGTTMQCLEIYTGESYTLPISFTDSTGANANALSPNAWALTATANYYQVTDIQYNSTNTEVILGNLTQLPNANANAYTLVSTFTNAANGKAYLYIPSTITNSGNGTPNVALANNTANSLLFLVTLKISKQSSSNASLADINREPLGFIVRYQ